MLALKEDMRVEAGLVERCDVIHGLRTFSRSMGTGRDVLLVHGAGVSSRYWVPAQERLVDTGPFAVHALDMPGFGKSQDPPWRLDLLRLADHIRGWVEERLPGRFDLVGQSLGCEITVVVAATMPERVRRLVLAAPCGLPTVHSVTEQIFRAALDAPHEKLSLFRAVLPDYWRCGVMRTLRALHAQNECPAERCLAHIHQPTLLLRGEKDIVSTAKRLKAVAREMPDARCATIPGAHGAHFTHPEEFAEVVGGFLGDGK